MNNLGEMYYSGHSVSQDYVQARQWYEGSGGNGTVNRLKDLGRPILHASIAFRRGRNSPRATASGTANE
jgi:TPR repeat protein